MEAEYNARFATITPDTEHELQDAQQKTAKDIDAPNQEKISKKNQATAFALIASKKANY